VGLACKLTNSLLVSYLQPGSLDLLDGLAIPAFGARKCDCSVRAQPTRQKRVRKVINLFHGNDKQWVAFFFSLHPLLSPTSPVLLLQFWLLVVPTE